LPGGRDADARHDPEDEHHRDLGGLKALDRDEDGEPEHRGDRRAEDGREHIPAQRVEHEDEPDARPGDVAHERRTLRAHLGAAERVDQDERRAANQEIAREHRHDEPAARPGAHDDRLQDERVDNSDGEGRRRDEDRPVTQRELDGVHDHGDRDGGCERPDAVPGDSHLRLVAGEAKRLIDLLGGDGARRHGGRVPRNAEPPPGWETRPPQTRVDTGSHALVPSRGDMPSEGLPSEGEPGAGLVRDAS
jgi:hypothetical protein